MKLANFRVAEWSSALQVALKKKYLRGFRLRVVTPPAPPPPAKKPPHFELNLGRPSWRSTIEMDGVMLNSVHDVEVRASVGSLTEVKLTMYATVKVIGAEGVEVERIVLCPACREKVGE